MIKSMTGFGRGEYNDGKRNIIVEIKSVNHRYSDISVKMPRRYSFVEDKVKNTVKEKIKRGKVDVSIMVENLTENDVHINLNTMLAQQYYDNLKSLQETCLLYTAPPADGSPGNRRPLRCGGSGKPAVLRSQSGSQMCIRDSPLTSGQKRRVPGGKF